MTSAPVMVPSWGNNPPSQLPLEYWKGKVARWRHLSLLAKLYTGVNSTSCQAEMSLSVLNRPVDILRSGMMVDKVGQLMLLRPNKLLVSETAPFVTRKLKSTPVP